MSTFTIIMVVLAILIYAASLIVRRKYVFEGRIMAWAAIIILLVAIIVRYIK